MVQILPEVPSFGTTLARNLGGGLSSGVSQAAQFAQQMAMQKEKFADQMALQKQKQMGQEELFKNIFSSQRKDGQEGQFVKLSPEQEAVLAFTNPSGFKAYEALKQGYQKKEEKEVLHQDLGNVLNQMSETLKGGKLGLTASKYLTARGRRDKQYFDSLGVQLESIAKDMISKGVLARDRFAYLLSNLPSSDKTDAANAGAIEAWSDELKIPRPEGLEAFYEEKPKTSKKSVLMVDSEGNKYNIPQDKVTQAEKQGFKRS